MRQFATQVSAKSFDGLLVIEPEGTLEYIAGLHAKGLPVVMIDDRGHQPMFPSVATTNRLGAEAAARLQRYGANVLPEGRRKGPLLRYLAHFHNVLIYVLCGSIFIKLMLNHWLDAAVIAGDSASSSGRKIFVWHAERMVDISSGFRIASATSWVAKTT